MPANDHETLTNENWINYAIESINVNGGYDIEEVIMEDFREISFIKRMLNKYRNSGTLKTRLLLNHLITLFNIFDHRAIARILFLRVGDHHSELKTCFTFLGVMPQDLGIVGGKEKDYFNDLASNDELMDLLQKERISG